VHARSKFHAGQSPDVARTTVPLRDRFGRATVDLEP
jgi:hypothetical protein